MSNTEDRNYYMTSHVNSFHYLYQDAEYLLNIARNNALEGNFERVRLCRTSLILFILSLEALINRAMYAFLNDKLRDFFIERESQLNSKDKWLMLPLLYSENNSKTFDKSRYPWGHFSELISVRNDYVHPKHNRPAYYKVKKLINNLPVESIPLEYNNIPDKLNIKASDVIYSQTKIPVDPYSIKIEHVETAKKIVDDLIDELDGMLDGKIKEKDWYHNDTMTILKPD